MSLPKKEQHYSVLIVDDDADTRYAMTRMLEKCGCTISQIDTVEGALELMESSHFDVVFSDMRFHAELGGEELLQTVNRVHPAVRVVLMSCAMDIERRQSLLEKGAAECLEKPFFRSACEDTLNAVMHPSHQRAA